MTELEQISIELGMVSGRLQYLVKVDEERRVTRQEIVLLLGRLTSVRDRLMMEAERR